MCGGHLISLSSFYRVPDSLGDLSGAGRPGLVVLAGEKDVTDKKSEGLFLETLGGLPGSHIFLLLCNLSTFSS